MAARRSTSDKQGLIGMLPASAGPEVVLTNWDADEPGKHYARAVRRQSKAQTNVIGEITSRSLL